MKLRIHALNTVEMDIAGLEQIYFYGGTLSVERDITRGPLRPFSYRERIELPTGVVREGMINPAPMWLIEGAEYKILVETGVSDENVETLNECFVKYGINQYYRKRPEHDVKRLLAERGVKPEEIDIIIATHLHPDHCSNAGMFKNAKIIAQQDTIAWALTPPPWASYYYPEFRKYFVDVLDRIKMIEGDHKITDGVEVWKVGGHVPGQQVVTVQTAKGLAIICGDAVLNYKHIENDWPMGTFWNVHEVMAGYARIRRNAAIILPQHDMEVWERYKDGIIG